MEPTTQVRRPEIEIPQDSSLSSFDSLLIDKVEATPQNSWIYQGVESYFRQLQRVLYDVRYKYSGDINSCLDKRDISLLQLQEGIAQVLSKNSISTLKTIQEIFFNCYQPSLQKAQKDSYDLTSVNDTFNLAIGLKQLKELSSCQANTEQKLQVVYELIPPPHYVSALPYFSERLPVILEFCLNLAQMQGKQDEITILINEIKKQENGDVLNELETKLFVEACDILVKNHYFEAAAQLAFKLSEERQEESSDILLDICKKLLQANPRPVLPRLEKIFCDVFSSSVDTAQEMQNRDVFLERFCKQLIFEWKTLDINPARIAKLANLIEDQELKEKTEAYIKESCPDAYATALDSMAPVNKDSPEEVEQAQQRILKHAEEGLEGLIKDELNQLSELDNKQSLTVNACRILIEKGNHRAAMLMIDFIINESIKEETVDYICGRLAEFIGNEDLIIQFVNTLRSPTQKTTILTNVCKFYADKRGFKDLGKLVRAIPEWSRLEVIKYICQQFVEAGHAEQIRDWCDNLPLEQKKIEIERFCKALAEHHHYNAAFQLFYALPSEIETKFKLDLFKYLCRICYVNHEFDLIIKKVGDLEIDLQQEILLSLPQNLAKYLIIDQALESVKFIKDTVKRVNASFYICSKVIENPRIAAIANLVKNVDETYQFDFFKWTLKSLIAFNPTRETLINAGHLVQMVSIKELQVYAIELLCVEWVKLNSDDYLDKINVLFTRVDEADQKAILEKVYRELSFSVKYQQQSAEIHTFFEDLQNTIAEQNTLSEKTIAGESILSTKSIIFLCHLFVKNGDVQRIKEQLNLLGEGSKPFYIEKFCKILADAGYQAEAFRLLSSYPESLQSDVYLKTIQYLFDNCIKCRQVEKVQKEFASLRPEEKEVLLPELAMMFARSLYLAEATEAVLQIKDSSVQVPIIKFICQKHAYRFEIREMEALMEHLSKESDCSYLIQEICKILVSSEANDDIRIRLQEATAALRLVTHPDLKSNLIQFICEQWAKIDDFINLDKIKELTILIEDEAKQGEVLSAVCMKLAMEPLFEKRALTLAKTMLNPPWKEMVIKQICMQLCLQGNFAKAKKEMVPFIAEPEQKEEFLKTIYRVFSQIESPYHMQAVRFICEECIHAKKIERLKELAFELAKGHEIELFMHLVTLFAKDQFFQANLFAIADGIKQEGLRSLCWMLARNPNDLKCGKKQIFLLEEWIKLLPPAENNSLILSGARRSFKPLDFKKLDTHTLEAAYQEANQLSVPEFRLKAIRYVIKGWVMSNHPCCWAIIKEIVDEIEGSDLLLEEVCSSINRIRWRLEEAEDWVSKVWKLSEMISSPEIKGKVQRICCIHLCHTEKGLKLHYSLSNEADKAHVLQRLICLNGPYALSVSSLREILEVVSGFQEEKNKHDVLIPILMHRDRSLLDETFEMVKEFSSPIYKNNLLYSFCRRLVSINMDKTEFEGKIKEIFAHAQGKREQRSLLRMLFEHLINPSYNVDAEIKKSEIFLKKIVIDRQVAQLLEKIPTNRDMEVNKHFQDLYRYAPASFHVHIQKLEQDFTQGKFLNASLLNATVQEIQAAIFNSLLEDIKERADLVVEDKQLKDELWSHLCQDWDYKIYLKGGAIAWD